LAKELIEKEESKMKITIIGAKKLESSFMDTIDPYMKISYDGQEEKTKVLDDNENPEWNESFEFVLNRDMKEMKISLWDSNVMSDSEYGHLDIDLAALLQNHEPLEHNDYSFLDDKN